ncbi:putative metalloprotease CJM1_0395 family protein [Nitrincola sp. A-D6]|uniref:putative metalloprotease CJM1_0395 family protein n=1 Tax=Nitrincola sp. A-D6 TaxID=1545442 RepID=UPI00068DB6FF|nr:putative metalloprotease CJM1_0395 family protein [Nitrincola sp. A-D6]
MQVNGFSNSSIAPGLNAYGGLFRERATMAETTATTGPVTITDATVQSDSGRRVAAGSSTSASENRQQQETEQTVVRELAARDREVRQHEMAHQAAGGQYTGGATYTFERGPDEVMYAVGGEVSIDTSSVPGDPEATLQKAERIERAALAPAEPSPQDMRVAASARAMAAEARAELLREQQDALQGDDESIDALSETETERESADIEDADAAVMMGQTESEEIIAADETAEEDDAGASRMAEVIDEFEAQQARREEIAEEQRERRERTAESLREFARDLAEIQDKLSELNKRLFETGALQNLNAPGSLLDSQA